MSKSAQGERVSGLDNAPWSPLEACWSALRSDVPRRADEGAIGVSIARARREEGCTYGREIILVAVERQPLMTVERGEDKRKCRNQEGTCSDVPHMDQGCAR